MGKIELNIWSVLAIGTLLVVPLLAFATTNPPPGVNNQLINNNHGQYGAVSAGDASLASAHGIAENTWSSLYIVGDQAANNNGLIPLSSGFGGIIAKLMGAGPTYYTLNSFSVYDCDVVNSKIIPNINLNVQSNSVIAWLPSADDPGFGNGNYTGHEADTNSCRLGGLTWMAIPKKYKIYAQAGFTPTGSWTNSSSYTGYYGLTSSTHGDSLSGSITTRGGPIYLWYLMQGSNGGTFTYSVDGGPVTTVATQGNNLFTFPINTSSQTMGAVRIPVTTSAAHTISVVVTSATSGSNTVTIEGMGTPANIAYHGSTPSIFLGGQILAGSNGPQTAAVAAFNNDQHNQALTLMADGLGTYFVDIQKYLVNDTTDYKNPTTSATLRFSGQSHIAEAFSGAMQHTRIAGNIVNPLDFGAACNSTYFTNQNGSANNTIFTTLGSNVISANGSYQWQPGVATSTGGGDKGKRICIQGLNTNGDVGPCTYISDVNTTNNTAILGANMALTTNSSIGVMGGYPSNPNDMSTAQDDTVFIQAAGTASIMNGGKVFLPRNCMVHELLMPQASWLDGNDGAQYYGQGAVGPNAGAPPQSSILYCGLTGYPSDSPECIKISLANAQSKYSNFTLIAPIFPFTNFGFNAVGIGYHTQGTSPGRKIFTDHLSFNSIPVAQGIAYGYNQPVTFTASIAPNPDGVTSTMNVSSIDSTNFMTADTWSANDFLALDRTVTAAGVPGTTTITSVPTGRSPNIGNYIVSGSLTVSSESMTSPANTSVEELVDNYSEYYAVAIALNGDFTDSYVSNSVCTGVFMKTCWRLGPTRNAVGSGGNRFIGGRAEEQNGPAAFTIDGGTSGAGANIFFSGVDMDFNGGYNIRLMGNLPTAQVTGGWMIAGGHCNTPTQDEAQISVGGTNPSISVDGVMLGTDDFGSGCGGTTTYLFSTATGASLAGAHISVTGGLGTGGNFGQITNLYNWTNGRPKFYKQNVAGWPVIDTTIIPTTAGLAFTTTNGGIAAGGGLTTTTTAAGTFTLGGLSAATNTWNCQGGDYTLGNSWPMTATTSTSCTLSATTTNGDNVWWSGQAH